MIVFILPKKRSYRKLYRRWFDSSIDVLTDRYNLKVRAPISSAQKLRLKKDKVCRQTGGHEQWHL